MKQIPYFEKDGSYNEREYKPHKRKQQMWDDVYLDFERQLSPQIEGEVSPDHAATIDQMQDAYNTLLDNGALPGNWRYKIQRQITNKVIRCMAAYRKQILKEFTP